MKGAKLLIVMMLGLSVTADAQQRGNNKSVLSPVQLVMLKAGPKAATSGADEMQKIVQEHVAHLYSLGNRNVALAAGPFVRSAEIQGIVLVNAPTPEKALEIEGADPGVKAGVFTMTAASLLLDKSRFGKWPEMGQFETLYFAVLVNGPDRTQSSVVAQKLQEQHLAYMDQRAAEGKLVLAGPFSTDSERRGIVVYRAPSEIDARQLAEADPMVKAGRLAVRLFTWQVPKGTVK
jgi:uncharacterized protein